MGGIIVLIGGFFDTRLIVVNLQMVSAGDDTKKPPF